MSYKIKNPHYEEVVKNASLRLNLGGGNKSIDGFINVDCIDLPSVDIVADLNCPLTFVPDNTCDEIFSHHCFEHINNFIGLMSEVHRVTKKGGKIEFTVPHFSNPFGYSDPTHVRFFGVFSMLYFVPQDKQPQNRRVQDFYFKEKFEILRVQVEFYGLTRADRFLSKYLGPVINRSWLSLEFYERRLSRFWHARQIRFCLTPIK